MYRGVRLVKSVDQQVARRLHQLEANVAAPNYEAECAELLATLHNAFPDLPSVRRLDAVATQNTRVTEPDAKATFLVNYTCKRETYSLCTRTRSFGLRICSERCTNIRQSS